MSAPAVDTDGLDANDFGSLINAGGGAYSDSNPKTWSALMAAIAVAFVTAAVQMLVFFLLRFRLTRIYRPRTYLVAERERIGPPPHGIIGWIKPVFAYPAALLIKKCGLDAYFFIRYLRMLLKLFVPMLCLVTPILLPINRYSQGTGEDPSADNDGLNQLTIANVGEEHMFSRLWAHLLVAIACITWILYNIYEELRGYIRVRQSYLTSPEHRLRASATTVLVSGIPSKWLTLQALEGLYDVFPGGIRNIWINRNFDEIADKISKRDNIAQSLEEAETNLIRTCRKKHEKALKKAAKQEKNGTATEKKNGHELSAMGDRSASSSPGAPDPPPSIPAFSQHYSDANGSLPALPVTTTWAEPRPTTKDSDQQHLRGSQETAVEAIVNNTPVPKESPGQVISGGKWFDKLMFWNSHPTVPSEGYPEALSKDFDDDKDDDAVWRKYIEPKDRDTMRLPIVKQDWFPALPFLGQKVDRIYHCRRELARLNSEIEADQVNLEAFPYMNSAFIQFNHQVAAHMACQSLSHHVPHQMTPRTVEISPDDVLWENMSVKWWEKYIRTFVVVAISVGLIVLYAVPVAFSALLSNIDRVAGQVSWLSWLADFPEVAKSIIQGVLPPAILQLILILVPIIYRALVHFQGVPTGNARELAVQKWYFVFLFIQVFLVVTLSSGLINFVTNITKDAVGAVTNLASELPKAATYFFMYLTVKSLASASGELLQVGTLIMWFLLGPLLDGTPRQKWKRQTDLSQVRWGSFFAPFTNFAVIGIVYSCIAPLMLVFMVLIFSLFWFVYRYNVLYVYQFTNDTGGLLFPVAVYQLFTGVYVMEICLAAYFFAAGSGDNALQCLPQAIIMIVCLALTIIFHRIVSINFDPLLRYLPITLEDDAVIRDEEFARALAARHNVNRGERPVDEQPEDESNINFEHKLKEKERDETAGERAPASPGALDGTPDRVGSRTMTHSSSWAHRDKSPSAWRKAVKPVKGMVDLTGRAEKRVERTFASANSKLDRGLARANGVENPQDDEEGGPRTVADVLFAGIADELEDLMPEERDALVRYAFQHSAIRARRPVVWFPKDELGVSDDEVRRGKAMSQYLAFSNSGSELDKKGKVRFERSPPDFSNVDLIAL